MPGLLGDEEEGDEELGASRRGSAARPNPSALEEGQGRAPGREGSVEVFMTSVFQ